MNGPPTLRQLEVLAAIHRLRELLGFAPSIRELCGELGVSSTNGMADHLGALERRGLIASRPNTARSLQLTAEGLAHVQPRRSA